MRVFLNPGHSPNGNPDAGACANNLRECDVVKSIADLVEKYLVSAGVEVVGNLQYDGLSAIANAANSTDADIFVSLHCNSAANISAHGTEVFRWNGSTEGYKLADCIQRQLVKTLGTTDRGVKEANFAVLRLTNMTAVLVEIAFISNIDDARILRCCQDVTARAIARGITDYQQLVGK